MGPFLTLAMMVCCPLSPCIWYCFGPSRKRLAPAGRGLVVTDGGVVVRAPAPARSWLPRMVVGGPPQGWCRAGVQWVSRWVREYVAALLAAWAEAWQWFVWAVGWALWWNVRAGAVCVVAVLAAHALHAVGVDAEALVARWADAVLRHWTRDDYTRA